jgi:hypothetical protein
MGVVKIYGVVKIVFFVRKPFRSVMIAITNIYRLWQNEDFFEPHVSPMTSHKMLVCHVLNVLLTVRHRISI